MIRPARRPILFFLFGLFLIAGMGTAFASAATGRVFDRAGLLSAKEIQTLQVQANEFCHKSGLDIVLVTTADAEGKTARQYADDFYDKHGFGAGTDKSGLLFLIDMDNREIHISTTGKAIPIFTEQRINAIIDRQYDKLKNGQYYDALRIGLNSALQIVRPPEMAQQQPRPSVQPVQQSAPPQRSTPVQQSALREVLGPLSSSASEKGRSGGPFLTALFLVLIFVFSMRSSYRKGFHTNGPGTSFNCTIQITRRKDAEISKTTVPYYKEETSSTSTAAAVATLAVAALAAASSASSSSGSSGSGSSGSGFSGNRSSGSRSSSGSSSSSSSGQSHGGSGRSFSSAPSSSSRPHGGGGRKF